MKNDTLLREWALWFASVKHCGQRRKDKERTPYISHPKRVEWLVEQVAHIQDPEIHAAALLHDTLEDTSTTPEELEMIFGKRIRKLVEELSEDQALPKDIRKVLQIGHARFLSSSASLIKIADKIANVEDVLHRPGEGWSLGRRLEYVRWATEVVENCREKNEKLYRYFSALCAGAEEVLSSEE